MPVIVTERDPKTSYLGFEGDDFGSYLDFTAELGNIMDRTYDFDRMEWVCRYKDAWTVQERVNSKELGDRMKLEPYGYQKEAGYFCLNHENCGMLQLPCGAGKTMIGLLTFDELRKKEPELIGVFVVKASLKSQWLDEVKKFTEYRASIIDSYKKATKNQELKVKKKQKEIEKLSDDFMGNADRIDELGQEIEQLREKEAALFESQFSARDYDILILNYETATDEYVKEALKELDPQFWFIDEVDCIKNCETKRAKALYEFRGAKYRYGATATPIRKNPKDIFGIMEFIRPGLFESEKKFNWVFLTYWNGRVTGSQNEDRLKEMIEPYIFSRTYDQIADQLPDQAVYQLYCDFTEKQQSINDLLMKEIEELKEEEATMAKKIPIEFLQQSEEYQKLEANIIARQTFSQMLADSEELLKASDSNLAHKYLTGAKGSPKVDLCIELLGKILASGEKVCIFSKYLGVQDILEREIKERLTGFDDKPAIVDKIYGEISTEQRHKILTEYNENDNHQILLLSDAGEAGLNLSSTRYMIEFELAESAAKQTQRHGRIQRADSKHKTVFVYQLICRNSFDEIAQRIINKKQGYNEKILA